MRKFHIKLMRLLNYQVWQNISSWTRVINGVWREWSIGQKCNKSCCSLSLQQTESHTEPSGEARDNSIKLSSRTQRLPGISKGKNVWASDPEFILIKAFTGFTHYSFLKTCPRTLAGHWDDQETAGLRVFTIEGQIEHVVTVGAMGASRGTRWCVAERNRSQSSFLPITGEEHNSRMRQKVKKKKKQAPKWRYSQLNPEQICRNAPLSPLTVI